MTSRSQREMSATPGRTTRARASRANTPQPQPRTAVPGLPAGQNYAYGAQGKVELKTQVARNTISVETAFQGARQRRQSTRTPGRASQQPDFVEEDDEEPEQPDESDEQADERPDEDVRSVTSKTPSRRGPGRPRARTTNKLAQPRVVEEEDEDALENDNSAGAPQYRSADGRRPTSAASSQPYGAEMDRSATVVDPDMDYAAGRAKSPHEPSDLRVVTGVLPRYVPAALPEAAKFLLDVVKTLLLLAAVVGVVGGMIWGMFSVASMAYGRLSGTSASTRVIPLELEEKWLAFLARTTTLEGVPMENLTQYKVDSIQTFTIERLGKRVRALEERVGLHDQSLAALEALMPSRVVVEEVNGRWEIPEQFWNALRARLTDGESADIWKGFLQTNEERLRKYSSDTVESEMQAALEKKWVISGQAFTETLSEEYTKLRTEWQDGLQEIENRLLAGAHEAGTSAAKKEISKTTLNFSDVQLKALANAYFVRNTQDAMQQHNYFSPGMGARVDPHRSSSTYRHQSGWLKPTWMLGGLTKPPVEALRRWEEAGDCWCTANHTAKPGQDDGKGQITVLMGQKIFPEKLVVEHIPATGTLNIDAAPRNLEVWVPARDAKHARQTEKLLREGYATFDNGDCIAPGPSDRHVCIGTGRYDIRAANWVQSFSLPRGALEEMGFAADEATIRVRENWGAPFSCLYRLRMTGTRVEP